MIPKNPPKFKIGDHVITTSEVDRPEQPEGYIIGLIALSRFLKEGEEPYWVYWEYDDWDGLIRRGFAEQHLEYYTGE